MKKRSMSKVARDLMGRKNSTIDPRPRRERTRADIERKEIELSEDPSTSQFCECYCHSDHEFGACGSCTNDWSNLCER